MILVTPASSVWHTIKNLEVLVTPKEASLTYRVVWIIKRERHGIAEHRSRFLKRDAVLAQIGCAFLCVPIKFHFNGFRAISYGQND